MKNLYKLTMLLLVIAWSTTLMATDYVVSGAGSDWLNGTYAEIGTLNGKPQYQSVSYSYGYLQYDNSQWEIYDDDAGDTYYYTDVAGNTPPSTGWDYDYGDDPAPTVLPAEPTLIYDSYTFTESSANDGNIDNSTPVIITHNNFGGGTFTGTNGDNFVTAGNVIVSNLPIGLTAVITLTSSTTLSVTITGTAPAHNNANDVLNLTFAFQDAAFSTGDASAISNSTRSDLMVDFNQEYYVATSGGDFTTIAAAIAVAGNGDVINVSAETFTEVELVINKNLTIRGQGADVTIIQAATEPETAAHRVFYINEGITVTIENVTIRHGYGDLYADVWGAGILIDNNANVTLKNSTVCYNKTLAENGNGGGIYNDGILNTTNCVVNNNWAKIGGGIANNYASSTITNSTITGNHSVYGTGAISNKGSLIINNCTISNNTSDGGGGGLSMNFGDLTISNTIIAGNDPYDYVAVYGIDTFVDNGNNIVKNQTYQGTPTNWKFSSATDILYNYKADGTASSSWNRNNAALANQNLNISSILADNNTLNGTQTLALSSGSFAIDAGTDVGAPTTDQRGAGRNGTTDIGAYEWWDDAGALPVELTSFSASVNSGSVVLYWQTSTEVNNYGFEIEKAVSSGQSAVGDGSLSWSKCGFVEGNGNSNSPKVYSFTDKSTTSGKYVYRLKQLDNDGKYEYSKEIEVDVDKIPTVFALAQNYPNPFNPATVISFQLPVDSKVQLKIYDVVGSEVATLVNEERPAGIYTVEFNAANFTSGVYFYRMQAGNFVETKKLLLIK